MSLKVAKEHMNFAKEPTVSPNEKELMSPQRLPHDLPHIVHSGGWAQLSMKVVGFAGLTIVIEGDLHRPHSESAKMPVSPHCMVGNFEAGNSW